MTAVIDLNTLELDGPTGLLATLGQLPDLRKKRGVRHRQASVLVIAAAAVPAGARSCVAIGEYAAECGPRRAGPPGGQTPPGHQPLDRPA
jgi:hypothetical protein